MMLDIKDSFTCRAIVSTIIEITHVLYDNRSLLFGFANLILFKYRLFC